MLRSAVEEATFHVKQAPAWARTNGQSEPRWQLVDRALREIASRRAALDAEEARWLREAEALQIWRPLGMVSAFDYLERVLGYAPRTAQDRLRVARALGSLPQLTDKLARGELSFSAVRELTRVATPATEASWIAAAAGKNLRQVEELVADHHPGDGPDDPPDPTARTHVIRFELSAETFALLRQARSTLDDEHHNNLTDDAFVAAMCGAVLDDAPAADGGRCRVDGCRSARGLELHHIVHRADGGSHDALNIILCSRCHQSHDAGVLTISGTAEQLEVRRPGQPSSVNRARSSMSRSDSMVPGVRKAIAVDSEHTQDDSSVETDQNDNGAGGPTGDPIIDGPTGAHVGVDNTIRATPTVAAAKLDAAILCTQAKAALTGLGWKPAVAHAAVVAAAATQDADMTLERLIFESLRRCPVPKA